MLSGLRSLPERARITEVAKDTEANASKRLYVLPRGCQGDTEDFRLEEGCLLLCESPGEV